MRCGADGDFFLGCVVALLVVMGGVWGPEVLGGVMVGEHEKQGNGDGDGDGGGFGEGMGAEGRALCGLDA